MHKISTVYSFAGFCVSQKFLLIKVIGIASCIYMYCAEINKPFTGLNCATTLNSQEIEAPCNYSFFEFEFYLKKKG